MLFNENNNNPKYGNDLKVKEIQTILKVIFSYIFILFVWQYTLSFQSSMYALMNACVLAMFIFGAVGLFICKEERENIIKHTKSQIFYYLIVIFVYDLFFKVVINDIIVGQSLGSVDQSLLVAKQWILTFSTVLKIGFPIAYVVWMLQKFNTFKSRATKRETMEKLRDVRKDTRTKINNKENNIDRF